jgi:phosphoenolpyruvate synthase/pyruvate phosphate dikinase
MPRLNATARPARNTEHEDTRREIENLSKMISAILSNPHTPDILSNKIIDALCELNDNPEVWEHPCAVEALLIMHNAGQGA